MCYMSASIYVAVSEESINSTCFFPIGYSIYYFKVFIIYELSIKKKTPYNCLMNISNSTLGLLYDLVPKERKKHSKCHVSWFFWEERIVAKDAH